MVRWKLPLIYFCIVIFLGKSSTLFTVGWVSVDYLNQFGVVGGNCSKLRRSILLLIWYATVWEIWRERNNKIFNGKQCLTLQLVDKIKTLSFVWLKAKLANLSFNYHAWWISPFTMLGIG